MKRLLLILALCGSVFGQNNQTRIKDLTPATTSQVTNGTFVIDGTNGTKALTYTALATLIGNTNGAGGGLDRMATNSGTSYSQTAVGLSNKVSGGSVFRSIDDRFAEVVNVLDFGADATGVTNSTSAFEAAKTRLFAVSPAGGLIKWPKGTYKGNFRTDQRVSMQGDTERGTEFIPGDPAYAVWHIDSGNVSTNGNFATYTDFTINCQAGAGSIGLILGTNAWSGVGNTRFERVQIKNFELYGLWVRQATCVAWRDSTTEDGSPSTSIGIYCDNERDVTVFEIVGARSRQNWMGMRFASGNRVYMETSRAESNDQTGVEFYRAISAGSSYFVVNTCWLEGNGHSPTATNETLAQIYMDGNAAYQLTNALNLHIFNSTVSAGARTNVYDISIDRGQGILIERTTLTKTDFGGFSTNKLRFADNGTVFAMFRQCADLNGLATPTMYANWPALKTTGTGGSTLGASGLFYEFESLGRRYSNRNPFGIAGTPIAAMTPAFVGEIIQNTSSGQMFIATGATSSSWMAMGLIDGNYGNITVSANGTVFTIRDANVTRAMIEGIGSGTFLGRLPSSGIGSPAEVISTGSVGSTAVVLNDTPTILTPILTQPKLSGMTRAQRDALTPANGLVIYQTDSTPGIRFYENGAWVRPTVSADP